MSNIIKGFSLKSGSGIGFSSDNYQLLERIGRILMTKQLERVNNPTFGSLVNEYLFEFPNILIQNIEREIRNRINMYEPKVSVDSVDIEIDNELANIKIYLTKKDNFERLTLEASLSL